MGWFSRMLGREAKDVGFSPDYTAFYDLGVSKTGVPVSWERALEVSTVLAVVRVVGEGVAQVPLRIMKPTEDGLGAVPDTDNDLYQLLYRSPNAWQTSFAMRETMIMHLMLTGDAFFFKSRVRGKIKELIPLLPGRVGVVRNMDMSLTYRVSGEDGTYRELPADMVWHIRGPSWNTWSGLDAVKNAREAIGLAIATETTQGEMHSNGLQMAGVLSTDKVITGEKYKELQNWIAAQVGGANKHKPLILDSALKWTARSMTGVDAQHLETRKFQIEEICRAFKVFPQMVGHSDKTATFASAESFFDAHVKHTLLPWCERIEQSIDKDLIGSDSTSFAKFNLNALQRGAFKDRFEGYAKALGSGGSPAWMTQDEVRALEDLNPMGGAAAVLPKPTNVAPAGDAKPKKDDA